jgi:ubiquinone/menaquinone biosynthesis C-methylase UbiE
MMHLAGRPPGAGHSSFELIDPARLWAELALGPGITFLDLGCGAGNYTFGATAQLGPDAELYAVDLWEEGIAAVKQRAAAEQRPNLHGLVADVGRVPLEAHRVDVCLLATVLHDLVEGHTAAAGLKEVARVLKPGGTLAIVEFYKMEGPPGPPLRVRLAPEEVEQIVSPYGFTKTRVVALGPYNYLMLFQKD